MNIKKDEDNLNDQNIVIEVNLTSQDVYDFYNTNSPISILLFAFCAAFLVLCISDIIKTPPIGSNPLLAIMCFLFSLYIFIYLPREMERSVKKSFETNKVLQQTQNIRIGAEGVEIITKASNETYRWSDFYKTVETENSFLFFISDRQAFILPKRSFEESQFEQVRNYMKDSPDTPKQRAPWIQQLLLWICVFISTYYLANFLRELFHFIVR